MIFAVLKKDLFREVSLNKNASYLFNVFVNNIIIDNSKKTYPEDFYKYIDLDKEEYDEALKYLEDAKVITCIKKDDGINVKITRYNKKKMEVDIKKTGKTQVSDYVWLFDEEREHLESLHGKEIIDTSIQVLNDYIGSSGKKYKSHYYAMRLWVVGKVKEDMKNSANKQSGASALHKFLDG